MSSPTPLANDFASINAGTKRLEQEKLERLNNGAVIPEAEMPKVWPSIAHSDSQADDNSAWGYVCFRDWIGRVNEYRAPDDDCA